MSPKITNVIKTQMSPKPKCHQTAKVTKTQMSPKILFHQNAIVTKTQQNLILSHKHEEEKSKSRLRFPLTITHFAVFGHFGHS